MIEIIILFIAGIGAGVITGLFGASAVMFAGPVLILFLGYDVYLAIGLALGIDVFASLTASIVYKKNKNVEIAKSLPFLAFALIGVLVGSYFSQFVPSSSLSFFEGIAIFAIGVSIFRRKKRSSSNKKKGKRFSRNVRFSLLVLLGVCVGLIAGVFGAGGGLMILLTLLFVLNYDTHKAIGTSVVLMIFIALFGAIGHYAILPFDFYMILLGGIGGVIGAWGSAEFANRVDEKVLNRIVGIILGVLGLCLFLKEVGGVWI